MPCSPAQRVLIKRALLKSQRAALEKQKRKSSPTVGGHPPSTNNGTITPRRAASQRRAICTSRFHPRPRGQVDSRVSRRYQYVCTKCRVRWADRTQTAQHTTEESIQEGLEAARTLIQMVNDGVISIPVDIEQAAPPSPKGDTPSKLQLLPKHHLHSADQSTSSKSLSGVDIGLRSPKCELDISEDSPREKKRRKISNPQLPLEFLSMVLSRMADAKPVCALDLLVPDWNACNREGPRPKEALEPIRVVTYTLGTNSKASTLSTTLGHGDKDHIFLPMKVLDNDLMGLNTWCHSECIRLFYLEGTQVFSLGTDELPEDVADESFLENWWDTFPLRGQRSLNILPFDDEQSEAPKETVSGTLLIFKLLRHIVVHSPLALMEVDARSVLGAETEISTENLEALNNAIDLDRASHLWLSWLRMPMLESVLLDLRIYSHDLNTDRECISKANLIRKAREMGRCLRLKLLVIAGLQSYSFKTSYESYTAEQIEEMDELDGEPNWIKIFMPALRPGGRLILVDR
ncbi:hypothetical protein F4677DRAFT_437915 [Hypoxylon crocopeplum]|nr:hypothetical protein F4677DRAFT_437915 [Hypoxylon crocopeplum]